MNSLADLRMHPDGRHIAFVAGLARDIERLLERPLPPATPLAAPTAPPGPPIGEPALEYLRALEPPCVGHH